MSVDFFDANIFIYLFDETDAGKRRISENILAEALIHDTGAISFQVVQETLNVITTRLKVPASTGDALQFLEKVLTPLWRIMPSRVLYSSAIAIQSRYRYSFYDALIIAAALEAGCARLLTEDMQHGQKIEGLVIVNPFLEAVLSGDFASIVARNNSGVISDVNVVR
ncbi:MAG: PIN domain-containing protein [Candidatus Hydrogenedentes bacterium]|nr:PIN domain-containing protein [Candidatus Hydrogenedentota bacterium]